MISHNDIALTKLLVAIKACQTIPRLHVKGFVPPKPKFKPAPKKVTPIQPQLLKRLPAKSTGKKSIPKKSIPLPVRQRQLLR